MSLSSFTNLELGPVQILFGQLGAETVIGPTLGGARLIDDVVTVNLLTDETGETPQGIVMTGRTARVECELADIDFAKMVRVIPGATLHGTAPNRRIDVKVNVGADLAPSKTGYPAARLILKRIKSPSLGAPAVVSTDPEDWIIANRVAVVTNLNMAFTRADQRTVGAIFYLLPDANDVVYSFGDEAATP